MGLKDRMTRAEDYVFGLMDERERMRAERDMAVDPEFRRCVLELAQKLQRLHETKSLAQAPDETWSEIAARIAELPQMAGASPERPAARRIVPTGPFTRPVGQGLHAIGGRRGLVVALVLAGVFALGYLAGLLL